jgi:hypothetical protein
MPSRSAGQETEPLTKSEAARQLFTALFASRDRVLISEVMKEATAQGISRATMYRARKDLGVQTIMNGRNSGIWAKPAAGKDQ